MKKLIKISFVSLLLTLFSSISYGRVIGNLTLGIPTVTVTDADMIAAFVAANTNQDCQFANFSIVSKNISYNPSTNYGFFRYEVSFTWPITGDPGSSEVSIPIMYDPGNNEFDPVPNGGMVSCTPNNCGGGCRVNEDRTGCTPCIPMENDKPSGCAWGTENNGGGGGGGGCGWVWGFILLTIMTWFGI